MEFYLLGKILSRDQLVIRLSGVAPPLDSLGHLVAPETTKAELVLIWYWYFTLYQCNSHFKLHTENHALNTRHQALLHHCVVYYIHKYQSWKIWNRAHIESLWKYLNKKKKEKNVSCVMCHGSPVTCNLSTTLYSFSSCRRFHILVSFWFEQFWEEPLWLKGE